MTIKEIPQDPNAPRDGVKYFEVFSRDRLTDRDEYVNLIKAEQEKLGNERMKLGIEILEEAQVPDILQELLEVANAQFPDIGFARRVGSGYNVAPEPSERTTPEYIKSMIDGTTVATRLIWAFQQEEYDMWNSLGVEARVLNGDLVVAGRDKIVIPQDIWRAEEGRQVIEESICNAFLQPGYIGKTRQTGLVRMR